MELFKQSSRNLFEATWRRRLPPSKHILKTLVLALTIFTVGEAQEASERLVKGQVYGIDRSEGVWVGVVTDERTHNDSWGVPHDSFEEDETPEEKLNWTFSSNGKFELTTEIEEEAVLLVVAKNRLRVEVALHPNEEWKPIEVSLSPGVGVKGVVRTKDGKPIAGATISFLRSDRDYKAPLFARPLFTSAADGSFHLAGLESSSRYIVGVTANGYAPVVIQSLATREDGIARLEVELDEGYFVSGRVVGDDMKPLPDVDVIARWDRVPIRILESGDVLKTTRSNGYIIDRTSTKTNVDGTFGIGPFAKGTTGRLYAGSSLMGFAVSREVTAPYDDLVLRLVQESVRGRALDETNGAPIENFTVDMYTWEPKSHTIESSDGVFDISVYPINKGGTEIEISAPGYAQSTRLVFGGSRGNYDLGDIRLKRIRTIRGTVRDAVTGAPIEKAYIRGVMNRSYDPYKAPLGDNFTFSGIGQSDGSGAFTLDNVSPRVESLYVIAGRGKFASIDLPSEVEEIDIELDFSGVIEGSLTLPDHTPVEGIVELKGSSWWLPRRIKSDGSFQVEGLTPDMYTLRAETDAGLVEMRTVTLEVNERLSDIDLVVQPGWSATGTITGLTGTESVVISAQDSDSNVLVRKRSGNGVYAIHGLPPNVTLILRSSSGHTLVREFLDGNAQGSTLDFHIEDESRLTGWLTSGGQPLRGMSLQIKPEDSSAVTANVTTTESGRYEARRLASGRHVIHTDTGHTFEVNVSGDRTFDIELPQNSLSGFVRGERTRSPIGGGLVKLVRTDTPESAHPIEISRRVGSDGTFLFEGLVSGEYDVLVEHPHAETASSRIQVSGVETVDVMVQCATTSECFEGTLDASTLRGAD